MYKQQHKNHIMSTSTPKKTDNEEIDLGVLVNSIGKGITKIFTAIGSAVMFLLNTLLGLIIFVRKRIVYYAVACGVGLLLGIFLESVSIPSYVATATLEPHFDSSRQLYSNVEYLDDLAAQNDSVQLSAFFGISAGDAATISSITISPFVSETRLLQEYSDYITKLDSIVATETSFKSFVKQLDDYDRKIHILTVQSSKQNIFGSLLTPLIKSVSEVSYFKDQQATRLANLDLLDSITQVSIVQTDSLLSLFEEVRLIEANKEFSNGTNLYMSESSDNNTELSLLERKITLTNQLEEIRIDKLQAKNVMDVVAAFPEEGYLETSFWAKREVQGIFAGFFVLSMFYFILHFDAFILTKSKE